MHIVRRIKKFSHIHVANVMHTMGFRWAYKRCPHNIVLMVEGVPKHELEEILRRLENVPVPKAKDKGGAFSNILRRIWGQSGLGSWRKVQVMDDIVAMG
jgi:hypothetical protein